MAVTQNPAQKRILYVITKSNWGGAQRYVYDLAVAAKAAGHEVMVAAGGQGELLERLAAAGIPIRPIVSFVRDVRFAEEIKAFGELSSLFREWRPDIVHLNSSKAGLAALAARMTGIPRIVFTVHGWAWNEERPWWQQAIIALVYYATILLCDRVIAVSKAARDQARAMPFVQGRFRVVHNGVHPIDFLEQAEARRKLMPDAKERFWIGTIAELHPIKGLPNLIEAFEHFASDYPDSTLAIIGEGEMRAALERMMTIEGVSGHAHLLGHVPQAARYLEAFDVFVLASRSEGLAYALLEAGAAGLPVVATDVGGIPEIIENGVTGILVPYGDREALTNALESLARDEALSARLATALYDRVARDFSLAQMTRDTFAVY